MSIAIHKGVRRTGFTLLEIVLAVAILAMMSLAIYRFVQSNITTLRISAEENEAEARYGGFINLVSGLWQSLPSGSGALTGEPFKFNDRSRDEVTWICGAGPGVLTRYAAGEFLVTLRLIPMEKSDGMELGLSRKSREEGAIGSSEEGDTWVPLMEDVQSLQIRYFDTRLNSWVDKWTDTGTLPRLIRLVIGRADRNVPYEAIIALGRTPL